MKRLLMATAAVLLFATAAQADTLMQVPRDVSAGHMNVRNGPGVNHGLVRQIPAGAQVTASTCRQRDDGIAGADWCFVTYGQMRGWVSQAGLLVVQAQTPAPTIVPLFDAGNWKADYVPQANGVIAEPMCVLSTFWTFKTTGAVGSIFFKWTASSGLFVNISKSSWNLPEGTKVPVSLWLDKGERKAIGTMSDDHHMMSVGINPDAMVGLMEDVAEANRLQFPQGTEQTWGGEMNGSRAATKVFAGCIDKVRGFNAQPVGPQASQPVVPQAPQASQPVAPSTPVTKKDDGSI